MPLGERPEDQADDDVGDYDEGPRETAVLVIIRVAADDDPKVGPVLSPKPQIEMLRDAPSSGRPIALGLIQHWPKDEKIGDKTINACAEGVDTKPSFRSAFARRPCLVPASGFYEWKREGSGRRPYAIALKGGEPITFAGLWENAWSVPVPQGS